MDVLTLQGRNVWTKKTSAERTMVLRHWCIHWQMLHAKNSFISIINLMPVPPVGTGRLFSLFFISVSGCCSFSLSYWVFFSCKGKVKGAKVTPFVIHSRLFQWKRVQVDFKSYKRAGECCPTVWNLFILNVFLYNEISWNPPPLVSLTASPAAFWLAGGHVLKPQQTGGGMSSTATCGTWFMLPPRLHRCCS